VGQDAGFPLKLGNGWVDSSEANENMRFKMREDDKMFRSFTKTLYSIGKGGKAATSLKCEPPGPQQKPGLSPVSSTTPQIRHVCIRPDLISPHRNLGLEIGPITQDSVSDIKFLGKYHNGGGRYIYIYIYNLHGKKAH